jgi:hypothetical protein
VSGTIRTRRAVLLGLAGAVIAGCGGGSKKVAPGTTTTVVATEPPPSSVPPTTGAAAAPVFPLTGQPVTNPALAARPALSVKIDNAPKARPQSGLDKADVVFEEVVEGGVVRFMAVFHSGDADPLGPIRSVRPVDASLLTTLKGYFAYSGGAPAFVDIVRRAPVQLLGAFEVGEGRGTPYNRRGGRQAPYNLFSSTGAIRAVGKPADPPPKLFTYRAPGAPLGGGATPARNVTVVLGDRTTANWLFLDDTQSWARATNGTAHVVESGQQLRFPNVILQFVPYRDTAIHDTSGAVSPEAIIDGDGDAWLMSGPAIVKGRWHRAAPGEVTAFTDASGAPMGLQPGPTWVSLVPIGRVPTVA